MEKQNSLWIKSNMRMRECVRFTEKPPPKDAIQDEPKCQCGKKKSHHDVRFLTNLNPGAKWKVETHTQVSVTNAYGTIKFVGTAGSGQGQQNVKRYIRVDQTTDPGNLLYLLQTGWRLDQPKLLISVTGGARNFPLKNRLKDVFRKGLIKAAISTGAWIITGGTNGGVMRYVGEAVRDYVFVAGGNAATNVIAIGIATWGVLDQKEALTQSTGETAIYRMDNSESKRARLDPNHTHFILVDDGTTDSYGAEIKLRSKLEKEISSQKVTKDSDERLNVPSICVVVGGGPNTVNTVYEAIKNSTPCLIIAGSGRAADILAYAFKSARSVPKKIKGTDGITREEQRLNINESVSVKIAEMLLKACEDSKDVKLDHLLTKIKECLQYPALFNVYELDNQEGVSDDIDRAILHALLKAKKTNVKDQLHLALLWNRVDVAQREIFTDDKDCMKGDLANSVQYAVEHDLPEFLDLFIEKGVSMNDYLTDEELTRLYNKIPPSTLLHYLLFEKNKKEKDKATLYDVGKIIQALTMDTYRPLYLIYKQRFSQELGSFRLTRLVKNQEDASQQEQPHQSQPQFNPIRELFIFSILLNREKMARLLWEKIDEAIPAALTASKMLKAMASKEDDLEKKESMVQHAKQYEELAIEVLNECYEQEEDRTLYMMKMKRPNWGNTTCLTMAVQAQDKKFIAQSGVQHLLNQIWMGQISNENSNGKLWMCMFCPPALTLTVKFRGDKTFRKRNPPLSNEAVNKSSEGDQQGESLQLDTADNCCTSKEEESNEASSRGQGKPYTWRQRLNLFYNAPFIKFRFNVLSYFAFLFLFSYIILTDFKPDTVSWKEWLLLAWVASLFFEECRQIAHGESTSWKHRFLHWISDYWNMVDLATLLLFGVGLGLRLSPLPIGTARIILALDLLVFYVRLLQIFSVSRKLGPKLIMIGRMIMDLLFFVCILAVFLIGYGVASYAIMFPNQSDPQKIFTGVFYQAYFQMYGELFLEEINVEGCTANQTLNDLSGLDCPEYSWIGILLLCGYMLLSNVLLLNLLIAMFSYTFSNVQDNTDEVWKFQRFEIIKEFLGRPSLPPPLIIISHCLLLFKKDQSCTHGKLKHERPSTMKLQQRKCIVLWEANNADNFITKQKSKKRKEEGPKITSDRVQTVIAMMDGHEKSVDECLTRARGIEDQLNRTNKAIDWIIKSMLENKLSVKEGPPQLQAITPREEIEDAVADDSDEDHEVPSTIEELGIATHFKSRTSPYPGTAMKRFRVIESKVSWNESFLEYKPVSYTHQSVLDSPHWADQDLVSISNKERPVLLFNQYDPGCQYNRVSHMGPYEVQDGFPLNPKGRTGMIGRGTLGRFGPNHAADPIVTRWERNQDGEIMTEQDKQVLEFIAIQRSDNQQWAIPGGFVEPGDQVRQTLLKAFSREVLGELDKTEEEKEALEKKVQALLKDGKEVYKGYVDDPRNTDNAWIETVAMNFHDDTGETFAQLEDLIHAGDDVEGVQWQKVSSKSPLFASHSAMLFKVAEIHKAAF